MERVYTCWVSSPLSEEISPLPAEGFMVPQTYNQPWGTFPLLWCIGKTLGDRVFRRLWNPLEYGWYLDLTCLCLVLLCILWTLLGLSGDQSPCRDHNIWKSGRQIEDRWESTFMFYLFVVQHQAHPPPERMQSIEEKSKDVAEWEQKAAGRAGWPGGILWWRKEFCDETSKNIHPKCKAAAGRMMCIRGRLPSWLTINIDNQM